MMTPKERETYDLLVKACSNAVSQYDEWEQYISEDAIEQLGIALQSAAELGLDPLHHLTALPDPVVEKRREILDTAVKAAYASHKFWLANDAICEEIFAGDPVGVGRAQKVNHNLDAYGRQSRELSAKVVAMYEE